MLKIQRLLRYHQANKPALNQYLVRLEESSLCFEQGSRVYVLQVFHVMLSTVRESIFKPVQLSSLLYFGSASRNRLMPVQKPAKGSKKRKASEQGPGLEGGIEEQGPSKYHRAGESIDLGPLLDAALEGQQWVTVRELIGEGALQVHSLPQTL